MQRRVYGHPRTLPKQNQGNICIRLFSFEQTKDVSDTQMDIDDPQKSLAPSGYRSGALYQQSKAEPVSGRLHQYK